jgi:choline-sulfatase
MRNHKMRYLLEAIGLCAALAWPVAGSAQVLDRGTSQAQSPNVILIISDDLNDSLQGMGGHPQVHTPNLERLMRQGVQFTHAYSNAPLCGPSRASFLTGLYPHTTGFYSNKNNWHRMRDCPRLKNALTFMEHFWANGYDVYGTGKIYHNLDHENRVWKTQQAVATYGGHMNWGPWPSNGNGREGFRGPVHSSLPKTVQVDNMFASLADIPTFPPDPANGIPGYTG